MKKHMNILLLGTACLLVVLLGAAAVKTFLHETSEEVVEEKNLRWIFEEHQMDLPKDYTVLAYDHTPTDFQGKSDKYYELEISDEEFLAELDTKRTEHMDVDFEALADQDDYREDHADWCFEDGTVINREEYFEASRIKYDKTDTFRTLFMWYVEDAGKVYILHCPG